MRKKSICFVSLRTLVYFGIVCYFGLIMKIWVTLILIIISIWKVKDILYKFFIRDVVLI